MKASELRIGNLLHKPNGDVSNAVKVTFKILEDIENGDLSYKGIPITDDWLLLFGFEKVSGVFTEFEFKLRINPCLTLAFQAGIFRCIGLLIDGEQEGQIYLTRIYYALHHINQVHQLQNLYFALTGEELTIKAKSAK